MRTGKGIHGEKWLVAVSIGAEQEPRLGTRAVSLAPNVTSWLAVVAIAAGLALVVAAQRLAPIAGPPLYDGVVVTDPYRWLSPPPGGLGGAQGATGTESVQGESPVVAIATPEEPPQAQIFAPPGALVMPPNTTSLALSIEPIKPTIAPPDGLIDGNVYEIDVRNQAGASVTGRPGGQVTVVLRGPPNVPDATIERFYDGSWQPLQTESAGLSETFLAVVTDFGDFALVVPAPAATQPTSYSGPSPTASTATAASAFVGSDGEGGGQSSGGGASYPSYLQLLLGTVCAIVIGAGVAVEAWRYLRNR